MLGGLAPEGFFLGGLFPGGFCRGADGRGACCRGLFSGYPFTPNYETFYGEIFRPIVTSAR